jgi:hypothetical protein
MRTISREKSGTEHRNRSTECVEAGTRSQGRTEEFVGVERRCDCAGRVWLNGIMECIAMIVWYTIQMNSKSINLHRFDKFL